jgi:hypothetical protein
MSNITLTASGPAQTTTDATATVTVTPAPAAGASLRFSLTVTDDLGNTSQPSFVVVTVQALPQAVITGPKVVPVGQPIPLVGSASTPTGHITKYTWQLVPAT